MDWPVNWPMTWMAALVAGYTLGPAQTLKGNGSVVGNATINGTLIPGTSIGTLTVQGNVTLAGAATDPVTITVAQSVENVTGAVQLFVDQYNKLRDKLGSYTSFNATDNTTGTLFGANEAAGLL